MSLQYERFLKLNDSNYAACYYNPEKQTGTVQPSQVGGGCPIASPGSQQNIYYADFSNIIGKQPVIKSQLSETPVRPLEKVANYETNTFCCRQPFWSPECI
jgi:hypothetical protein